MDQENEIPEWHPVPAGFQQTGLSPKCAPYEASLLGEYARLILLVLAFPLVVLFGHCVANQQPRILCLIATSLLLSSLITSRGNQILRIGLLVAMAMNVFALAIAPSDLFGRVDARWDWAANVLLFCLVTASFFEILAWAKSCPRRLLVKTLAWGIFAVPALAYVVGVPIFEMLWDGVVVDEKKNALKDPNWSFFNEAAFRAAKFFVFALFTYVGACIGSFLNVVAYCVPRGEAIGLRDSKCPACETKIGRIDNLPIFSFVNLGGRCRNCSTTIPARYLIAELVVAFIFGSLFLYELVTGCANMPHMPTVTHQGILWIILYPKWPVIAMYFYHALFMCFLLVLSLIERDKQPLKLIFSGLVALAFFLTAAIYHPIQCVPLFEHWPGGTISFSPWIEQLIKLLLGATLGAAIGGLTGKAFSASHLSILVVGYSLTGMVLGWQALLQATVFFGILSVAAQAFPEAKNIRCSPTAILLAAVALHHPFWKTVAQWWTF